MKTVKMRVCVFAYLYITNMYSMRVIYINDDNNHGIDAIDDDDNDKNNDDNKNNQKRNVDKEL